MKNECSILLKLLVRTRTKLSITGILKFKKILGMNWRFMRRINSYWRNVLNHAIALLFHGNDVLVWNNTWLVLQLSLSLFFILFRQAWPKSFSSVTDDVTQKKEHSKRSSHLPNGRMMCYWWKIHLQLLFHSLFGIPPTDVYDNSPQWIDYNSA